MAKFIEAMQPLCVVLVLGVGIIAFMLLAIYLSDMLFKSILGQVGVYVSFIEFAVTRIQEKKAKRKIGGK